MKKENVVLTKVFMREHEIYDGEYFVKFNIVDINVDKSTITIAVSTQGRVSVQDFDLLEDENQDLYFEYGMYCTKVDLDYFDIPECNNETWKFNNVRRLGYATK